MEVNRRYLVLTYGVFHNLSVVEALHSSKNLGFCVGTMPYYFVRRKYNIPRSKYLGLTVIEVLRRKKDSPILQYLSSFVYEIVACIAQALTQCNTLYSTPLVGARFVKRFNGLSILDRGSTHTCENIRLKNKAFISQGINESYTRNVTVVEMELREYELYDKILVPSGFVSESFKKRLVSQDKMIQIPYALKSNQRRNLLQLVGDAGQEDYFVFVGHATPRKGIHDLVNLWKKLSPPQKLVLIGNYSKQFEDTENSIIGLGIVDSQKVLEIINKSLGLIMMSYEEGMSLALLEASACGVPVIGTEETGIVELMKLGYPGSILIERNSESLHNSLNTAIQTLRLNREDNPILSWNWKKYVELLNKQL